MPNIKRGMMGAAGVSGVDIGGAGTLWAWGDNGGGQNGQGNKTQYSSPVQIGSAEDWSAISCGHNFNFALRGGTLWSWGAQDNGQLGHGSNASVSSPVQIGSATNWTACSTGGVGGAAIKGGTLWTWGWGVAGWLGLGSGTTYDTPQQVGSLTDWKIVQCGEYHMQAVKDDGTLWAWGNGNTGRLGEDVSGASISSPIQIGSMTNWLDIQCYKEGTMALKTDGTLWGWGLNNYGQLGLGDTTNRSSPVQVGSLTNWPDEVWEHTNHIFCKAHQTIIVKTDGALWSWGGAPGPEGISGLGSNINYSSPVQVGSLTTWGGATVGQVMAGGIQTDGTLWTWGGATYGKLGQGGPLVSKSSPVQVGSDEDWQQISAGTGSCLAVRKA